MTSAREAPRRGRRWTAIASEIAIVVVGILIAFALDSWWDRRADARREIAHLLALRADFQVNAERLRDRIAREERTLESSRNLLRLQQYRGLEAQAESILARIEASPAEAGAAPASPGPRPEL